MASVTLYDLPSKAPGGCWSLNPWKTRMVLNLKKIEYSTEWIEYPDVAPKLKSFGLEPNSPKTTPTPYSIPAIRLESGKTSTYIMDSIKIAHALEDSFPTPSLHLDSEYLPQMQALVGEAMEPLRPFWMPEIPRKILNPVSAAYFERTRAERVGMPLEQMSKEQCTEERLDKAKVVFGKIASLLETNGGPFVLGKTPSYADFVLVSFLIMLKKVNDDVFNRCLEADEALIEVWDASQKWIERDDH